MQNEGMARNKNKSEQQRSQRGQDLQDLTEDQAREHLEALLWPDGQPVCRHCGSVDAYRMQGKSCRPGLCRCRDCKKQFTVTVGTIFEGSHIPLRKWVRAFHLMCSSKKGISALQLQRNLGLGSYKTAWHMAHRIRCAMQCGNLAGKLSGVVESDEAFIGGKPRKGKRRADAPWSTKVPVQTLVERGGRKRTVVMTSVTARNLKANLDALADKQSVLMTDENNAYKVVGKEFAGGHKTVEHGRHEYAKPDGSHINTAESSHALIKRGVYGTFHHVSPEHLQRYLDEFDFRWDHRQSTDTERTNKAIAQAKGKRLMYREPAA